MGTVISVLLVVVCILLILIVLVQNSKGGGLSSTFASSNQVMGVRKTADFLEKTTWGLAIGLLLLCLLSAPYSKNSATAATSTEEAKGESVTKKKAQTVIPPVGAPSNNNMNLPPAGADNNQNK